MNKHKEACKYFIAGVIYHFTAPTSVILLQNKFYFFNN
jgi:hypothetical protein